MRSCIGHREEARNQATTCGVAVSLVQFFVLWLVVGSGSGVSASAQHRTACVSATVDCTEWIELETSPQRVRVYRSHPLYGTAPANLRRALVLIHGGGRNAVPTFATAGAAALLNDALSDTLLIAPRFSSNISGSPCGDRLENLEANWGCEDRQPDSWRNGSTAKNDTTITSYDFIDVILRQLGNRVRFPDLQAIVIAGNSGGGQFTLRYAMTSDVPDTLDVPVSYVVSNPDAFVYFDEARPTEAAYLQLATPLLSPVAPATDAFGSYVDARNCATFDDWPYGLKQRSGYSMDLAANSFAARLSAKNVTYLLGRWDVFRFDSTCPAMAQGPTRLARGIAYSEYMNTRHNADHAVEIIRCGHSGRCMFTSQESLVWLFPELPR